MKNYLIINKDLTCVYDVAFRARGSASNRLKQLCSLRGLMASQRKSGDGRADHRESDPFPAPPGWLVSIGMALSLGRTVRTESCRYSVEDSVDAGYLTRRLVDVSQGCSDR